MGLARCRLATRRVRGSAGPGVLTWFGPALRQPVGCIHWAGTEIADNPTGHIDGAIQSGEGAAQACLTALHHA